MRHLTLLLAGLLLFGCETADRTLVTQAQAVYSLNEADQFPMALRIPLVHDQGLVFVQGSVDGQWVGPMLFDTGSTLNIIDKGVVNRLGLEKVGEGKTVGIAGSEGFNFHAVDSLTVAGLDLGVKRAGALSMRKLTPGLNTNPAGLIGSVSLMPHPFTVDYKRSELLVYNRDRFVPPADAVQARLSFYSRLPAVRARLANGREVLLLIDTGMDGALSLPIELSREPGILATTASGPGISSGVGGQIRTQQGWLKSLDVFEHTLTGVPVTFEPAMRQPRRTDLPIGRIGGQVLQGFRLTFDARYSKLWVSFASSEKK